MNKVYGVEACTEELKRCGQWIVDNASDIINAHKKASAVTIKITLEAGETTCIVIDSTLHCLL